MTGRLLDEVVDDSEPEREEWRREIKFTQKTRELSHEPATAREVIELTDDESDVNLLHRSRVIDISDYTSDSESGSPEDLPGIMSITKNNSKILLKPQGTSQTWIRSGSPEAGQSQFTSSISRKPLLSIPSFSIGPQLGDALHSPLHSSSSPNDNEDTNGDLKVDIGRFAFISSRPYSHHPVSGPSRITPSLAIEPSVATLPKKKAVPKVAKYQFTADFSDTQLAKLNKCVSCNARWTTRKTAIQKSKHIESCAKKYSFSDETVRLLIQKELESVVENIGKPSDKGKVSIPPVQSLTAKTFYEHVTDAGPKKKGRRAEVSESVRSIATTREAILSRARAVLESVPLTEAGLDPPACAPLVGHSDVDNGDFLMPSTQPFGRSSLAHRHRPNSNLLLSDSLPLTCGSQEDGEPILATQTFAVSKLSGAIRPPPEPCKSSAVSPSPCTGSQVFLFPSVKEPLSVPHDCSPEINSAKERSPSPALKKAKCTSKQSSEQSTFDRLVHNFGEQCDLGDLSDLEKSHHHFDEHEMHDDNVYLHFDPGYDSQQESVAPTESDVLPRAVGVLRAPYDGIDLPSMGSTRMKPLQSKTAYVADIRVKDSSKTKETSAKRKRKGKQLVEPEGDIHSWEARMRDVIVRDTDLHLRILRYEPIHFDVFLKLATDEFSCLAFGKLKGHLRNYLDKEAINFYGTGPNSRRR